MLAERERRVVELPGHGREPIEQSLTAGNDDPGMAPQHLRTSGWQMKLAPADIDPHIGVGHHQIGVSGEPKACDIKQGGQPLVGHRHVDVFEMDRIAEIFCGTVKGLLHGRGSRVR